MKYLFWNTNKRNVDTYICKLSCEYTPTIIALAEYERDIYALVELLKKETNLDYMVLEQMACRVHILIQAKLADKVEHCQDHRNYTIKILPYNSFHEKHIVVFLHLPSKMQDNRERNRSLLEQIVTAVERIDTSERRKVLIFGDFNLNPYEDAMTYLTGCNAVSSRNIAKKISRKSRYEEEKQYFYYYNPMWNFLGDEKEPCGTFYYTSTPDHSRYWNTFDQFVVSPELMNDIEEVKIVKDIGEISLGDEHGIPKISDHYPLFFKLGGLDDGKQSVGKV